MAVEHKDTDYHMVIGSGMLWGEAYDYAMCILEEMQWIKTNLSMQQNISMEHWNL